MAFTLSDNDSEEENVLATVNKDVQQGAEQLVESLTEDFTLIKLQPNMDLEIHRDASLALSPFPASEVGEATFHSDKQNNIDAYLGKIPFERPKSRLSCDIFDVQGDGPSKQESTTSQLLSDTAVSIKCENLTMDETHKVVIKHNVETCNPDDDRKSSNYLVDSIITNSKEFTTEKTEGVSDEFENHLDYRPINNSLTTTRPQKESHNEKATQIESKMQDTCKSKVVDRVLVVAPPATMSLNNGSSMNTSDEISEEFAPNNETEEEKRLKVIWSKTVSEKMPGGLSQDTIDGVRYAHLLNCSLNGKRLRTSYLSIKKLHFHHQ